LLQRNAPKDEKYLLGEATAHDVGGLDKMDVDDTESEDDMTPEEANDSVTKDCSGKESCRY
jgi:hypothetical protein